MMGIFNIQEELAKAATAAAGASTNERPKAQTYMNPGIEHTDPETGEVTFIGLPFGLAIDTMNHREITGNNPEWRALASASNDLLDYIQKEAEKLEPGEAVMIEGLKLQIRKRSSAEATPTNENKFASVLSGISLVKAG